MIGCGAIGTVIAGHLVRHREIGTVRLADVDPSVALRVSKSLAAGRTLVVPLDAGDPSALREAAEGVSVVVNAAIPQFNDTIQEAALEAGANYVDLANMTSTPFGRDAEFRNRDLTALIGLGEDPGLSNLFARHGADGMDRVESIRVRDGDTANSEEYPFLCLFSPETFIQETLNSSRIWEDGTYQSVPPFGRPERFVFPEPVGALTVYSVDHEEVDTLPRQIGKGVQNVDFKLALDETTVRTLQLFRDLHLLERGTPTNPGPRNAILSAIPRPADLAGKIQGTAALLVEIAGEFRGRPKTHTIFTIMSHPEAAQRHGTTGTAYLTGTSAAAGVILLASGKIADRGVVSPESLDPMPFFELLQERGIEITERVTVENRVG